ncbi:MAG TPA: hypothetical protein VNX28_07690, partial [Gemmataceae bacterium]|nr:hypothetical protein [Gemmataceae bacterium]
MGDPALGAQEQTGSWGYSILPYIELGDMYRLREWKIGASVFICQARRRPDATPSVPEDAFGKYQSGSWAWARTDYGACIDSFDNRPNCRTVAQFTDGLSNTVLVGEK